MIELELTYLAKYIPNDLKDCPKKDMIDVYIPAVFEHPSIRIRKNGDKYELTKKEPISGADSSRQLEQTIKLTEKEFNELSKFDGKRTHKVRYLYSYEGLTAEFDVFQDEKEGLVIIDFEFKSENDKNDFKMPGFCLSDVTQEKAFAGGMVCGKTYEGLKQALDKYNYKKLFIKK